MTELTIGYLAIAVFCNSGVSADIDGKCPDGTKATQIELRLATRTDGIRNLLEVVRNGKVILVVPATKLTLRERDAIFGAFEEPAPPVNNDLGLRWMERKP